MPELLRVGAVARALDRSAERDHGLTEPVGQSPAEREEADQIVAEYERGEWRLVRLELFADVLDEQGRVQRYDSVHVDGVWFRVPHGPQNVQHAREAADTAFDELREHLGGEGVGIPTAQLETAQFVLELDERLAREIDGPPR